MRNNSARMSNRSKLGAPIAIKAMAAKLARYGKPPSWDFASLKLRPKITNSLAKSSFWGD
jgi:hypothetical protein